MHARLTRLEGSPERIEEGIAQYRDTLATFREFDGNQGAFLLVDRDAGAAVGVTLWESEDAMTQSRERANQLREQAAEQTEAGIKSVEEYEVAVWEVS
jgi:heme-degrading monooxygenase HmoA